MTEVALGFEAKIAPELAEFAKPLSEAKIHPDNVRKHSLEKIAQSLRAHGQRALIVVQASTGYIVKGNGTYSAAELLGWDKAAMIFQDMSDEEALAFLYADNRASDLATYDRKKLSAGLNKMMTGPGLFDTLWEAEELADLDEELAGAATLEQTESDAAFATADGGEIKHERAKTPGDKMKEVPLLLSVADHAMFVARVKALSAAFGTTSSVATIAEAVRRQAEWEASGQNIGGKALTDAQVYAAKREVVKELRDYFIALGEGPYSATQIAARLEAAVPYQGTPEPVAEGQMEAFPEGEVGEPLPNMVEDPIVDPLFVAEAPKAFDIPAEPTDDAEYQAQQAEALARYRARR